MKILLKQVSLQDRSGEGHIINGQCVSPEIDFENIIIPSEEVILKEVLLIFLFIPLLIRVVEFAMMCNLLGLIFQFSKGIHDLEAVNRDGD